MTTEAQGGKMDLGGVIRRVWGQIEYLSIVTLYPSEAEALLDHALAMEARGDRLEFEADHRTNSRGDLFWCQRCGYGNPPGHSEPDPRHTYGLGDWLARVREKYGLGT